MQIGLALQAFVMPPNETISAGMHPRPTGIRDHTQTICACSHQHRAHAPTQRTSHTHTPRHRCWKHCSIYIIHPSVFPSTHPFSLPTTLWRVSRGAGGRQAERERAEMGSSPAQGHQYNSVDSCGVHRHLSLPCPPGYRLWNLPWPSFHEAVTC